MSGVKRFRIYRNNINIVANENHTDIWDMKKYPHYKLWLNVLRYFKSREFIINKNDYIYRNFQCLSQYHKSLRLTYLTYSCRCLQDLFAFCYLRDLSHFLPLDNYLQIFASTHPFF